ncbi:transaldolase family protein [Streptomyces sp. MUM 178J]|uniref:transaldolase family protein n=1 Tax=Streptomyces sp. MUM 178J TaxID=2791991 RepID=UPI0023D9324A|nr:transaldolase family protein [Streptomyces sp. MUM 178J]WRQ82837.1 transaldolase family protein [Streptomyces sp. MUM 178J]
MNSESAIVLLKRLAAEGVSPWLADSGRGGVTGGAPDQLTDARLFRGAVRPPSSPADARRACDALWPVHEASGGHDGHVSVPVNPGIAHDAQALTEEARRIHREVGRPNLLVRIPATSAGLVALGACVADGIGVDSALVFCAERYGQVLDAFFSGMERALASGLALQTIACVASFPVGPLDSEANARLGGRPRPQGARGGPAAVPGAAGARAAGPASETPGIPGGPAAAKAREAAGRTRACEAGGRARACEAVDTAAVAVARQVFRVREERLASEWWRVLRAGGARPPRLLWTEPHSRHIASLIGWNTAIAMPLDILETASDELELLGDTLLNTHGEGRRALAALERHGVRIGELAGVLETAELARLQHSWEHR